MFHTYKTTMTFGTLVIVAVRLLFALVPIVGNQKALSANLAGSGLADPDQGISYPSPPNQCESYRGLTLLLSATAKEIKLYS